MCVYNYCDYCTVSSEITGAHLVTSILQDAMERLSVPPLSDTIEGVYIMGGSRVYKVQSRL